MIKIILALYLFAIMLLISACSNELPPDLEGKLTASYGNGSGQVRKMQFEVAGAGQVLPEERQEGFETLLCFKVRYEKQIYHNDATGVNSFWSPAVKSGIIKNKGNIWNWEDLLSEATWQKHACPGVWERKEEF